jgi:hypothetical protein
MQWLLKGVGGEKDNPISIDKDNTPKTLLYKPKGLCCKIYLKFTLALKKRSKSNIFTQQTIDPHIVVYQLQKTR